MPMKIFNFSEVFKNYLMTFIERRAAIKKCRRIIGKYVRFRFIAKKFSHLYRHGKRYISEL